MAHDSERDRDITGHSMHAGKRLAHAAHAIFGDKGAAISRGLPLYTLRLHLPGLTHTTTATSLSLCSMLPDLPPATRLLRPRLA